MRTLLPILSIMFISFAGCSKDAASPTNTAPAGPTTVVRAPAANFRITNTLGTGSSNVMEGTVMKFVNSSENGETYLWDFGNGTTSTERIPSDVKLWPCSQNVTVTLTVTNRNGVKASISQPYFVICARTTGGKHEDH